MQSSRHALLVPNGSTAVLLLATAVQLVLPVDLLLRYPNVWYGMVITSSLVLARVIREPEWALQSQKIGLNFSSGNLRAANHASLESSRRDLSENIQFCYAQINKRKVKANFLTLEGPISVPE